VPEVDDLRFLQLLGDGRDQRQFVIELAHRQAAQIADHEQGVGINGIGVEQIVLHASDHAAESRI